MLCSSALSLYWGLQRWERHTCHVYYSLHFCQVLWQTQLRECVVDSEFLCDEMCSRKQTEICIVFFVFVCVCVWVRVRVCSSGPLVCPAWALSLSVSRRVWEVGRAAQIDPQTSEPRARNRRFLCRWGAVCISGSQGEAKQKQHPVNTSTPALKQKKKTENMEHSPENVEERLLLKMQCCVIQDLHQQKCRWEENISQRRMN